MKVDLHLSRPGDTLAAVSDIASFVESSGYDGISYGEISSDPLLQLTVAAGVTSRLDLITNIAVAFARSPMTLAVESRAIQEYSGGRFHLGLGSQVRGHIQRRYSMPWGAPAARMEEFISALRAIWHSWETGDTLDFRGAFYTHTLMAPIFVPRNDHPAPKVFLAAVGERMTEVAGAVADGMLVHPFSTERYFREVTLPALSRGRARAGRRDSTPFEIVSAAIVVTGTTEKEHASAIEEVRARLAFDGSTSAYRPVLALHGWGDLADELHRLSRTPDEGRWDKMSELIDDEVVQAFAVVGEPETIGVKLRERWGDLVTRYEVNDIGIESPEIGLRLLRDLRG
jgi:probable F420-dependent oxidoreductase